ncbi:hypothetical protein Barb4_04476 [Bacteroidales bacterium Barb4]|nr:hypothetical protein Barb4_04476 [Bacteroidales bacterium Barb4]
MKLVRIGKCLRYYFILIRIDTVAGRSFPVFDRQFHVIPIVKKCRKFLLSVYKKRIEILVRNSIASCIYPFYRRILFLIRGCFCLHGCPVFIDGVASS